MNRWLELAGAVNVRDVGGLATTDEVPLRTEWLLRSDNLQDLTPEDVAVLVADLGIKHVIDLRSDTEVRLEGPGPLTREASVTIHPLSLFNEGNATPADLLEKILPWQRQPSPGSEAERGLRTYLGFLSERPESIVTALRVIADGPSIVHCAAGKDRTGVVVAFALSVAGVTRDAILADYVATEQRLDRILARLHASSTYGPELATRPDDTHRPYRYTMDTFMATVDENFGSALGWLERQGWTDTDTKALRQALRTG